jgi:cytochrome P450
MARATMAATRTVIGAPARLARARWRVAFARDPMATSRRLISRYGDLVALGRGTYLVGSAELAEIVLRQPAQYVRERGQLEAERSLWGKPIVVSHGAPWLRKRRLLEGTLDLARSAQMITQVCADEFAGWSGVRPVSRDLRRLTVTLAARNILGDDLSPDEVADLERALNAVQAMFVNSAQLRFSIDTPQKRDFRAAIARLDELVHRTIRRRLDGQGLGRDMASLLIAKTAADAETVQEVRDELVTQLRAGHRNGAVVLTWIVGLLAHHPDVADQVSAECRNLGDAPLVPTDVDRLVFLGKVVREAMRLYPLYPLLDRTLNEVTSFGDVELPKGTRFLLATDSIHRDARYYATPDEFQPQRWTADFERSLPRGAFQPFGSGPRICPFRSYGTMEVTLVTAELARRFQFTPTRGTRMARRFNPNGLLPRSDFEVMINPARPSSEPPVGE